MNIKADKLLFIERYSHTLFFGFFIIGLLLSLLYSNHQIVSGNQEQMLDKGYLVPERKVSFLKKHHTQSTIIFSDLA